MASEDLSNYISPCLGNFPELKIYKPHSPWPRPPLWHPLTASQRCVKSVASSDSKKCRPSRSTRCSVPVMRPFSRMNWRKESWVPQLPGARKTSKILTFSFSPESTFVVIFLCLNDFDWFCMFFLLQYQTCVYINLLIGTFIGFIFGWPFILNVLERDQPCRIAVITLGHWVE